MELLASVTLKHLRCFVEVYHTQSVADAAQALGITQSAASRRVSDLESVLETPLFTRTGRRLVPNMSATLLLRHAEEALRKLGAGLDLISGTAVARPTLAIGALPTVAATLVPRAVLRMRAAAPELLIRVETGAGHHLLPRLRAGQLDCVVGRMAAVDQLAGLHFEPLFMDRLAFVTRVGHPLLQTRASARAIAQFPLIVPPEYTVVRPIVDTFLTSRGIGLPEDRIETAAEAVASAILRETDAIWLISRGVAEAAVAEGRLAFLPIDTADTIGSIGMTRREDDADNAPELATFFDGLRAALADDPNRNAIP